jgi:hypothetical protein
MPGNSHAIVLEKEKTCTFCSDIVSAGNLSAVSERKMLNGGREQGH